MLKLDFYESGIGETIIITFPSGGIGVVDAHPSPSRSRPDILQLVQGKHIHFACLTHPHADHGVDLVTLLQSSNRIQSLWHTISDFKLFNFYVAQTQKFPSPIKQYVDKYNAEWSSCFLDLFGIAREKKIPHHQLRADQKSITIDTVEIHILSPKESIWQKFVERCANQVQDAEISSGDENLLSAIIALKYGSSVILLGADALKRNWTDAAENLRRASLPRAVLLKIPHHGAANALHLEGRKFHTSYLDLCSSNPKAFAVLFAGDVDHPNDRVYEKLRSRTRVACISNGAKRGGLVSDPLRLAPLGRPAQSIQVQGICNSHLSFNVDATGTVNQMVGCNCETCPP